MAFVPPGALLAIASTSVWTLPTANEIKDGWALANGLAYPAGSSDLLTGNRPNLTDDRFLMGSTAFGAASGVNSFSLVLGNIPSLSGTFTSGNQSTNHTHTVNAGSTNPELEEHTHTLQTDSALGDHTHPIRHYDWTGNSLAHNHNYGILNAWISAGGDLINSSPGSIINMNAESNTRGASNGHTHTSEIGTGDIGGAGPLGGNHTHAGTTGGINANHSHTYASTSGGDNANHTHSTLVTLGNAVPATIENRPFYFSVIYLIRVQA